MNNGRYMSIVGGMLLIISAVFLEWVGRNLASIGLFFLFGWYLELMPIIQFICGLLLIISNKEMITFAAGLIATFFSATFFPLSINAALGTIGGILGLAGTFIMSARTPLEKAHTPERFQKNCIDCGGKIPIASEECSHCGASQKPDSGEPTSQPLPLGLNSPSQLRASAEPQSLERLFCTYCGAEIKSSAVFCSKCGKKTVGGKQTRKGVREGAKTKKGKRKTLAGGGEKDRRPKANLKNARERTKRKAKTNTKIKI